ncbi:glutamate--tRNA ligase [Mycoplasma todarodis]|uniref:glutamate--tRNA ligase n=1 Tax=Mycoplasma todarodis TaxID=1937191 RepID=UPI003B2ADD3D
MKNIRTRYAPSPTGYLHIGGARTALFCYLFAKHNNGDFIVRIEDTDVKRNVEGGEDSQLDNLEWLGITPDESPRKPVEKYGKYRQSEKLDRYNAVIEELIANGHAYKAYDSSEELTEQRDEQEKNGVFSFRYDREWLKISDEEKARRDAAGEFSVRLALPKNKDYTWKDMVRGNITVNTTDIGDFVIKKQDGYPTYNLAVVIDDHDMEISHVFRGEEHTTNTPKQLAIYDLLGWEAPEFAHLTIITNMEGKKLSKRDLSTKQFIADYKDEGYMADAIFNFLALLGWTAADASEVNTHQELIEKFDWQRWSKSPSKFDTKKMEWFSKQYFKQLPNDKVIERLKAHTSVEGFTQEWLELFSETYKQNAVTTSDIVNALEIYRNTDARDAEVTEVISTFKAELAKNEFSVEGIQAAVNATKEITGAKGKSLFMPIRLETTYQQHGPELAKAIYLFGQELIEKRLANV